MRNRSSGVRRQVCSGHALTLEVGQWQVFRPVLRDLAAPSQIVTARWRQQCCSAPWPFPVANGVIGDICDAGRTIAVGNGAKGPFCCCISLAFVAPSARTMSQYTGHSFGSGSYPRVESSPSETDAVSNIWQKRRERGSSSSQPSPGDLFGGAVGNDVCRLRVDAILERVDRGASQCAGPVTFFLTGTRRS